MPKGWAMASTALTDEDRQQISELASQGLSTREIARQLEVPGRSVGGYISHLKLSGLLPTTLGNLEEPRDGIARTQPTGSVVSEVAAAIRDGVQLGRDTARQPEDTGSAVESATRAIKTGIDLAKESGNGNGNGNGKAPAELLQFLTTVVTQQREAHQHVMEQIQTRHDNDLSRIQKDHDLKMAELKLKVESERERDKDYWQRIEASRQETDKQRLALEKEERALVAGKLDTVNEQVKENLEHANRLIEEREKASDRYMQLQEKFTEDIAALRKELGKDNSTEEVIKYAIDRVGDPIIHAIQSRAGDKVALPETTLQPKGHEMGGVVDKLKNGLKSAYLSRFKPYIEEGIEQLLKHLRKWPDVGMEVIVDWLWSMRMYAETAAYVQTAITFILLNDLDEVTAKAGNLITGEARTLLAGDKAKEWWAALQKEINERVKQEREARAAYGSYLNQEPKAGE